MRRIGHKGADLIAPGNTPASFDAALAAGRRHDRVRRPARAPRRPGRDARARPRLRARRARAGAGGGARAPRVARVRRARASTSTSSCPATSRGWSRRCAPTAWSSARSSRRTGCLAGGAPRRRARGCGSAGRCRACAAAGSASPLTKVPAYAGLAVARARRRRQPATSRGRCDALMANWRLITPRLVRAVRRAGGDIYVWTVDEPARIGRLERLGVTGVITNDPRLFGGPSRARVSAE